MYPLPTTTVLVKDFSLPKCLCKITLKSFSKKKKKWIKLCSYNYWDQLFGFIYWKNQTLTPSSLVKYLVKKLIRNTIYTWCFFDFRCWIGSLISSRVIAVFNFFENWLVDCIALLDSTPRVRFCLGFYFQNYYYFSCVLACSKIVQAKKTHKKTLFPEMRVTRIIFTWAAANLFFLINFPEIFSFLL